MSFKLQKSNKYTRNTKRHILIGVQDIRCQNKSAVCPHTQGYGDNNFTKFDKTQILKKTSHFYKWDTSETIEIKYIYK